MANWGCSLPRDGHVLPTALSELCVYNPTSACPVSSPCMENSQMGLESTLAIFLDLTMIETFHRNRIKSKLMLVKKKVEYHAHPSHDMQFLELSNNPTH